MDRLDPVFLLSHPEIVTPAAPWCARVDNVELGILLLAQPWIEAEGWHRADLERGLGRLSGTLPVGPLYFQRINRAVARLETMDALGGEGKGRRRRFRVTPRGFATLVLNLQVLEADPTLTGGEFEMKRALVATWHLVLDSISRIGGGTLEFDEETGRFFDEVERLELWGQRLITDEILGRALDILSLIDRQRAAIESRMERIARSAKSTPDAGHEATGTGASAPLASVPMNLDAATLAAVRGLALATLPRLHLDAATSRYRRYLEYLDDLARLHRRELQVVNLGAMRRLTGGSRR